MKVLFGFPRNVVCTILQGVCWVILKAHLCFEKYDFNLLFAQQEFYTPWKYVQLNEKVRQESGITRETSSRVAVYLMSVGWIKSCLQLAQFLLSLNTHESVHHLRGIPFLLRPYG